MKTVTIHLKMKWKWILFGALLGMINPLAFRLIGMLLTDYSLVAAIALSMWAVFSAATVMVVEIVMEYFELFLPNARRLGVPVSIVYQLRYQREFTDNMINIFCTPKWDELLEKAKNGTLK